MEGDFSQRMGLRPASKSIQIEDMDRDLRTGLWNAAYTHYWNQFVPYYSGSDLIENTNMEEFASNIQSRFLKLRLDELPIDFTSFVESLGSIYQKGEWHRVYSFIEFVIKFAPNYNSAYEEFTSTQLFIKECNDVLQAESSAYRIVNGLVTRITDPQEIAEIDTAISAASGYAGVKTHLQTALAMLTDRQNPDFRNSIKESISAVESLAKQITGNPQTTLAPALSELERHHALHPALKSAFSSLYGWTSNADGIRHALMDVSNLTHADARWMLISCSAFINFAIDTTRE
ncbi:hypothetical protein NLO95_18235 [Pseudomonas syringae]|nr:hypothetical protein [Pseudomonas syringae]